MKTITIPSLVGVGETDLGLLSLGEYRESRAAR